MKTKPKWIKKNICGTTVLLSKDSSLHDFIKNAVYSFKNPVHPLASKQNQAD